MALTRSYLSALTRKDLPVVQNVPLTSVPLTSVPLTSVPLTALTTAARIQQLYDSTKLAKRSWADIEDGVEFDTDEEESKGDTKDQKEEESKGDLKEESNKQKKKKKKKKKKNKNKPVKQLQTLFRFCYKFKHLKPIDITSMFQLSGEEFMTLQNSLLSKGQIGKHEELMILVHATEMMALRAGVFHFMVIFPFVPVVNDGTSKWMTTDKGKLVSIKKSNHYYQSFGLIVKRPGDQCGCGYKGTVTAKSICELCCETAWCPDCEVVAVEKHTPERCEDMVFEKSHFVVPFLQGGKNRCLGCKSRWIKTDSDCSVLQVQGPLSIMKTHQYMDAIVRARVLIMVHIYKHMKMDLQQHGFLLSLVAEYAVSVILTESHEVVFQNSFDMPVCAKCKIVHYCTEKCMQDDKAMHEDECIVKTDS
jgi:hypothetical protein